MYNFVRFYSMTNSHRHCYTEQIYENCRINMSVGVHLTCAPETG